MKMYRSFDINYFPSSKKNWVTFNSIRKETTKLWNDLVKRHHRIRRLHLKWPNHNRWCKWAKGKYPELNAQSVQLIVQEFVEALNSITALRKKGHLEAEYPWKTKKYRDTPYTNQGARIRKGYLLLPNGKSGTLAIKLSKTFNPSGKLMEARLCFGKVILTYKSEQQLASQAITDIGIDLGVNTLIAATDGQRSILISGREIKSTVQWRNKKLASISSLQASKIKRSSRWKKLQRRKAKMLTKTSNRVKDLIHKATRKIANFFPYSHAFVGEPFQNASRKMGRVQAQQISQCCTSKITRQLEYKLSGSVTQVNEAYSSQTCPVCGCRSKHRRIYQCKGCGFKAPRDVVGSLNILSIGKNGKLTPNKELTVPSILFKYPGIFPGSSGGSPARSSSLKARSPLRN
jgi:putative transposase